MLTFPVSMLEEQLNKNIPVSVVMLSFNRRDDVAEGLEQLLAQDYENLEIIVVDNGSSDQTAAMVNERFPGVHLIALPNNIGVAAYNIGFKQARGKYIVILDDDSFPAQHAIQQMVEAFEKDPQLGVVAFDVRNYYDYFKNRDATPSPAPTPPTPLCHYQMAFNGAGVGIRKKCIDEVGGYPDEFFLYWNEQDLAIRILNAGYRIQSFNYIISLHKYSPANRQSWRAPFFYTRNLFWLIWKHFYLSRMIKDTLIVTYFTLYYSFEQKTLVYIKAAFAALFGIGKIHRKPVKKEIIRQLRLTYHLAFIYYQ